MWKSTSEPSCRANIYIDRHTNARARTSTTTSGSTSDHKDCRVTGSHSKSSKQLLRNHNKQISAMPRFRNMCSAIFKGKKVDDSQSSNARTPLPKPPTDRRAAPTTQLDKPKDEGNVRKGDKLPTDTTTEAKKQNAEPPRFPLDGFWSSTATTHDVGLAEARKKYQESVEKLAGMLRGRKDPKFMPDVQAYYASGQAQALQIPEFTAVTNSIQGSREQQVQRWYTQVGHDIAVTFPAVKVVLGLTGTIAEYASFAPVKITANGLGTVFDVSYTYSCHLILPKLIVQACYEKTRGNRRSRKDS